MTTLLEFSSDLRTMKGHGQKIDDAIDAVRANIKRRSLQSVNSDREQRAALIAAGKSAPPTQSVAAQIENDRSELADLLRAKEIHTADYSKLLASETQRYLKSLRPQFCKDAAEFAQGVLTAYEALAKMDALKGRLMAEGVGFFPHVLDFASEAEAVFGDARDKSGALGNLLRELVKRGHLDNLPSGMK